MSKPLNFKKVSAEEMGYDRKASPKMRKNQNSSERIRVRQELRKETQR